MNRHRYDQDKRGGRGATRRDALGLATALLGAGVLGFRAPSAHEAHEADEADDAPDRRGQLEEQGELEELDGGCQRLYDPVYESLLEAVDEEALGIGPEELEALGAGVSTLAGAPQAPYARPVTRRYRVSAPYGIRGDWLAGHHTGVDLAVPRGTPVRAVAAGTVVLARWSGAYGKAITIRMGDGRYALYAHLSKISVRDGSRVKAGQRIARSGDTGRTTGPHLHLEIRAKRHYGSDIDPVRYLAKRGIQL